MVLQELSELTGKSTMEVALKARQLLIRYVTSSHLDLSDMLQPFLTLDGTLS